MKFEGLSFQKSGYISVLELNTGYIDTLTYISSSRAYKENLIDIDEISESGSVNNIKIRNKSPHYIFFMDGDILTGAKQNRVINSSAYILPNVEAIMNVSCIERGRWKYKGTSFSKPDYILSKKMRLEKKMQTLRNLRDKKGHYADQNEMWLDVAAFERRNNIQSQTSDYTEVYEKAIIDKHNLISNFKPGESANGMAIFIGNELTNIEIFNRKDIYTEYYPMILKSLIIDEVKEEKETGIMRDDAIIETYKLLNEYENSKPEQFPGLCAGIEKRLEGKDSIFYQLEYENVPLHFSYMKSDGDNQRINKFPF